jgi:hypothetical protein
MLTNMKFELRHFLLISFMFISMTLDLYFTDRMSKLDYKDIWVFILIFVIFIHGFRKFIILQKKNGLEKSRFYSLLESCLIMTLLDGKR